MVTEKAQQKFKILGFWKKYGLSPTREAYPVKERTLYHWQAQLKKGGGRGEALNEESKRPKTVRRRQWSRVITERIKALREEHPNLGKEKLRVLLMPYCQTNSMPCPSVSTIGNLIRDMGGLRRRPVKVRHDGTIVPRKRAKKARKPKYFKATYPGHCGSLDTIEKVIHGCRRYVLTFTDVYSRFSLAWATMSHASKAAKEFFDLVTFLFPFPFTYILTDNGSEFMKEFEAELKRLHLIHWHTYPKTPKMNAHAERFNRSIQEEYIDYHEGALLEPSQFNVGLMKHLLWHNTERPHHGLQLQTPVQFITTNNPKDCNMYLTNTIH
jgi:transposase InsO family protein